MQFTFDFETDQMHVSVNECTGFIRIAHQAPIAIKSIRNVGSLRTADGVPNLKINEVLYVFPSDEDARTAAVFIYCYCRLMGSSIREPEYVR